MSTLEDVALMQRIAAADQTAFRSLYDRFAHLLYRYALSRLHSPTLAQDAVQDTLLAVWRDARRYTGASSLSTYLFGICHHKVTDLVRKSIRQRQLEEKLVALPEAAGSPESGLTASEALQSLPDEMRNVLVLAFHIGLSYNEIADILQVPVGTVKSRVFNARKRLSAWMKGDTQHEEA